MIRQVKEMKALLHLPNVLTMRCLFGGRDPFRFREDGIGPGLQDNVTLADRMPITSSFISPNKGKSRSGAQFDFYAISPYELEPVAQLISAGLPTVDDTTDPVVYRRELQLKYLEKERKDLVVIASMYHIMPQHFKVDGYEQPDNEFLCRHLTANTLCVLEPHEGVPHVKALLRFKASADSNTFTVMERLRKQKRGEIIARSRRSHQSATIFSGGLPGQNA